MGQRVHRTLSVKDERAVRDFAIVEFDTIQYPDSVQRLSILCSRKRHNGDYCRHHPTHVISTRRIESQRGDLDSESTRVPQGDHKPATVFLDRDGVLNRKREADYVRTWTDFEFLPKARQALALLTRSGYRTIIVTNQRGIARGFMTEADLAEIHDRMIAEASAAGGVIAAIYHCPHDVGECSCRKPEIGMFLQAQRDFPDIDFSTATVIGDSASDVAAGARLGCRTILIGDDKQHRCAASLHDAVVTYLT